MQPMLLICDARNEQQDERRKEERENFEEQVAG
jgi:hypothetical protein